ncbi:hypothetical protein D3C73_1270920 [compost metagenome]
MSFFKAASINKFANFSAFSDFSPTITLEGYKLSYNALPSRKNSGENIIFCVLNFILASSVYPTGTVDLITKVAFGLILNTLEITLSTLFVSK